jgi:hypothetical protein
MVNAYGSFRYGMFVVDRRIPLSAVTVDFFMVRTIQDWFDFFDSHNFNTEDCWNVTANQVVALRLLQLTVHPKFYTRLSTLIALVYYCSNAYRNVSSIEDLLHRQVYPNREKNSSGLTLTHETRIFCCIIISLMFTTMIRVVAIQGLRCSSVLSATSNHHLQLLLFRRTSICSGCVC